MKKHLTGILFILLLLVGKNFLMAQENWMLSMNGFDNTFSPSDFAVNENGDIYIACNKYNSEMSGFKPYLFKSTNNGSSWSSVLITGLPDLMTIGSIDFNGNTMFLAGYSSLNGGLIYTSTDNGLSWTLSNNGFDNTYSPAEIAVNTNGDVYIACNKYNSEFNGFEPYLFKSTNNGSSWSSVPTIGLPDLMTIGSIDFNGNTMFLAGYSSLNGGLIYTCTVPLNYVDTQSKIFNIYPNPAQSNINIQYNTDKMELFKIMDVSGKEMGSILLPPFQNEAILNTSKYPKGIYIYTYGNLSGKIVIQ